MSLEKRSSLSRPAKSACWLLALLLLPCLVSCSSYDPQNMTTGGNYPPVTRQRLIGTHCSNQTGGPDAPLDWTFDKDGFQIKARTGKLPGDIVGSILGPEAEAASITGKWTLQGEDLILTELRQDGQETPVERAVLHCFNTGVIRIETTGPEGRQYVFSAQP